MKISKLFHWLYAILMLLPVFAIGVTCAYAIFNKNAYQSYSGKNENSYIQLTDISQVELNKTYQFSSVPNYESASNISTGRVYYTNPSNINGIIGTDKDGIINGTYFIYYARTNFKQIYVYDSNDSLIATPSFYNTIVTFDFELETYTPNNFANMLQSFSLYNETNFGSIDNVFLLLY